MSAHIHRGVVYFVTQGRYVKIGYCSGDLDRRLASLKRDGVIRPADLDRSAPITVLHAIPDCITRDERRIHGLFAAHHAAGEWYHLNLAFLRHLAGLEYVTDAEVLARFRHARAELKRSPSRWLKAAA